MSTATAIAEKESDELNEVFGRYLSAKSPERAAVTSELARALRAGLAKGEHEQVAALLRRSVSAVEDYTGAQALYRVLKELRAKNPPTGRRFKVAVLGGFTTKQISTFIDLSLFGMGVEAEIYESDFGLVRQEILSPDSGLYSFEPQVVWVAVGRRDLGQVPDIAESEEAVAARIQAERQEWGELWQTLYSRAGCQIIQNNFVLPAWRVFGNHEMRMPGSLGAYISGVNRALLAGTPAFVTLHDVDHLASNAGRWSWDDARFVHHAKLPCAPEHIWDYARSVSSLVGVQRGLAKKCVVLDLDNTLWGGVIGDDGLGGIRLGQGNAEGEAYLAFQDYLKALKKRGILLAVCSKNTDSVAREVFERHPEMRLRLDDISCFIANWNDKATNIRTIATELNIGLNSLVFVDDNPAERAIVRQLLPEVAVPELSDDVTSYVWEVDRHRYFQTTSVAAEDFQRADFYRAEVLRRAVQTSSGDMETYLQSLRMVARIEPVNTLSLERTVQLIQRSNQFNLTTRRYSVADVSRVMSDPQWASITVTLADKFGDNGLISVAFVKEGEGALEIDTWLMSCRVLKRGVELALLNYICGLARSRGLSRVRGEYIPTPKNDLVREHYATLGFTQVATGEGGKSVWELNLDGWNPPKTFIELAN